MSDADGAQKGSVPFSGDEAQKRTVPFSVWKNIGPGLVVAATGLGAGDIVAAAVAGAQYGTTLGWVALAGALLKFCLNEGIGRWQLVTGRNCSPSAIS